MKRVILDEKKIRKIIRQQLLEDISLEKEKKESKPRCLTTNTIPLDDIVGTSKDFNFYVSNLNKRDGGINGMVDALDILRTLRLHPHINDGGEHLSYDLMNHLNMFRNKHYYDETNGDCLSAMDKVIELYKENEHGEELVRDIEKVLNHKDPTPRAKEYLKRCLNLIKER
jgi:hypothetical protein